MRLKATFSIDLEAGDFVEAADHQRTLERMLSLVRETFPTAELRIINRRAARARGTRSLAPAPNITGRLHTYVE